MPSGATIWEDMGADGVATVQDNRQEVGARILPF
jgi:hypothetical protein